MCLLFEPHIFVSFFSLFASISWKQQQNHLCYESLFSFLFKTGDWTFSLVFCLSAQGHVSLAQWKLLATESWKETEEEEAECSEIWVSDLWDVTRSIKAWLKWGKFKRTDRHLHLTSAGSSDCSRRISFQTWSLKHNSPCKLTSASLRAEQMCW